MSLPTYAELLDRTDAPPGSSWGLWGDDDRFGSLNLLTRAAARRGAASVRSGAGLSLNASLRPFDTPLFGRAQYDHVHSFANGGWSCDEVLSSFNTQCSSQLDGFGHIGSPHHGFYNGLAQEEHEISRWAQRGIVGRGVLVDVADYRRARRAPIAHDGPDPVTVDDLRGAVARQGLVLEVGDVVIIHTGWLEWARRHRAGGFGPDFSCPGLRPSSRMLELLWDWHPAIVASDTPSVEVWPKGSFVPPGTDARVSGDRSLQADYFMHPELIAMLGIPLGELWWTTELAAACAARGSWTFLLTSAPLNLPSGVASTANAMAVL